MFMGGWSNTISVTGPRVETTSRAWRASATGRRLREQVPDRAFERHAITHARMAQRAHAGERGVKPGDRIRDRRSGEARRSAPRHPAPAALRGQPVTGTVFVRERRE